MLTLIPINSYKAKSTGNLENKGIPTTSVRCIVRTWDFKLDTFVKCKHRANFVLSKTAPKFEYRMTKDKTTGLIFKGMKNELTLYCALHVLQYIDQYRISLESKMRQTTIGSGWTPRTEKACKMIKTRIQNELKRIDDLSTLVHKSMKKNKDIAADLLEV